VPKKKMQGSLKNYPAPSPSRDISRVYGGGEGDCKRGNVKEKGKKGKEKEKMGSADF
jgi:hypothetical protein